MSLADVAVGLKVFLHTDEKDVYSGFMGRYIFLKEKSIFGDGEFRITKLLRLLPFKLCSQWYEAAYQ